MRAPLRRTRLSHGVHCAAVLHERPSQKITLYQIVPVPPTLIRLCVLVVLALTQKACLLQGYSVMAAYIFLIAVRYPLPATARLATGRQ